ncbi:uncharacterized protein [Amphiura filiformis]|uniref:uncharacterized protein n=1 Tax=Amphiura filiformis TaxID=82378 RepID=UPI003B222FBF
MANEPSDGEVRLVGGQDTNEGRVEVFYDGRWGTVCADSWDDDDAMVVCRQLSFRSSDARGVNISAEFGQGNGPVWLDGASCSGSESRLDECSHNGWGNNNCSGQDAGVICNDDYDGQVRLVGGNNTNEGRVEVFHNSRWGTVCGDSWDDDDAMVVCRQLGFPSDGARGVISTLSQFLYTSAEFGQGTGPVWLDDVSCSGSESRLDECSYNGWGNSNCNGQDAGVICNDGEGKVVTPLYKNYVFSISCLKYCSYPAHVFITTSSRAPIFTALSIIDYRGIPGYEIRYNNITRDNPASIRLPSTVSNNYVVIYPQEQMRPLYKTLIVRASDDVSVYVMNNWYAQGDAFTVLPTTHLGTRYYIASYTATDTNYPAFISISSISSDTSINITTPGGELRQIMLKQFESFRFNGGDYEDLSGTRVQSDKPIAVLSGTFGKVPTDVNHEDGLLEQLPPVHNWGYSFILTPFLSVNSGYVYRVYTSIHSATLQMADGNITRIASESFHEEDVKGDTIVTFTSDQPIMVVQYMKGYSAHVETGLRCCRGNPSMLIVPPTVSFTNIVTFLSFQFASCKSCNDNHYTSVIIACVYVDKVFLDESPMMEINSINVLKTPDQAMCCLRTNVSAGPHTVSHTNPMAKFYVTVYGMHHFNAKSYAFAAIGFETAANGCASAPCQHGGICTAEVSGYACACVDGYEGVNCEIVGSNPRRPDTQEYPSDHAQLICQNRLGVEDGRITNSQITASTEWHIQDFNVYYGTNNARLNRIKQRHTAGAWCPQTNDANQWIQSALDVPTWVSGVLIQGRHDRAQWVTQFKVQYSYSNDGNNWMFVQQENNQGDMIFDGNTDQNTVVTNLFPKPVIASYIRIVPTAWNQRISMRFELLGCVAYCNVIATVPDDVRSYYSLDKFYTKYTSAYGIPILSSSEVSDNALQRACYVVQFMLADRKDIRKAIYDGKGRVAVFGVNQRPKDIPEHSSVSDEASDRAAGGFGGTLSIPVTSISEKNLLCLKNDGYYEEDILIHEFAHAIHLIAMKEIDGEFQTSLQRAYANAKKKGLWKGTYAITKDEEYFAEGVQTFFNVNTHRDKADDIHHNISTRDSLYKYDQELFQLVSGVFPCSNDVVKRCQGQACVNDNDNCYNWAGTGECGNNPGFMHKNCQKICGFCNDYDTLSQEVLIGSRNLRMDCRETICHDRLGVEDGRISDIQLRTSSARESHAAGSARLNHKSGWVAATSDNNQWIEVDLGGTRRVTGVLTQGLNSVTNIKYWVTQFKVQSSSDGNSWEFVQYSNNQDDIIFKGNTDTHTVVTNIFPTSVKTSRIRIVPTTWNRWIGMRFELIGCVAPYFCQSRLGVEDGRIIDSQITASTEYDSDDIYYGANNARLNRVEKKGTSGAWSAKISDGNQWIQAALDVPTWVTGVLIQGRHDHPQYVTQFKVQYSNDGKNWKFVQQLNDHGEVVFDGNADQNTVITNLFPTPVIASYIRVLPTVWNGGISMRFELIGCVVPPANSRPGSVDYHRDAMVTATTIPVVLVVAVAVLLTIAAVIYYKRKKTLDAGVVNSATVPSNAHESKDPEEQHPQDNQHEIALENID